MIPTKIVVVVVHQILRCEMVALDMLKAAEESSETDVELAVS
jgi:hypothetical protein